MTVRSVVFDLDGTLVDSSPDIAAALNRAFEGLNVRRLSPPEVLEMLGGGPAVLVENALDAVGYRIDGQRREFLDGLVEAYTAAYRANPVEHTAFFADAAETIMKLHAAGLRLGVCTNKRTDLAERVLTHLGVRDHFGAVVGIDSASSPKPSAAHLLETLDELKVSSSECVYVGDTEIDAQTAAAAHVRYAHVRWGRPLSGPRIELNLFADLLPLISNDV